MIGRLIALVAILVGALLMGAGASSLLQSYELRKGQLYVTGLTSCVFVTAEGSGKILMYVGDKWVEAPHISIHGYTIYSLPPGTYFKPEHTMEVKSLPCFSESEND